MENEKRSSEDFNQWGEFGQCDTLAKNAPLSDAGDGGGETGGSGWRMDSE